jgi:hypothetical protein
MRIAGFLFLPAGWFIVLSALMLLPPNPARAAFALAGMALEVAGFVILARGFAARQRDPQ